MELILKNDDVVDYLRFLHETDQLGKVIPELVVPQDVVMEYISYVQKNNNEKQPTNRQEEPDTTYYNNEQPALKRGAWKTLELGRLTSLIEAQCSLPSIAKELNRPIAGVRGKARTALGMLCNSSKGWYKKEDNL